jgi:hypothetical protein
MTVCDKHRRNPVRVYHQCIGCELDGYRDRIEQLTRECDEARAVIERLPKTADNVPIVLGMTVWAWLGHRVVNTEVYELSLSHCGYDRHVFLHRDVYSTYEAAEAARHA